MIQEDASSASLRFEFMMLDAKCHAAEDTLIFSMAGIIVRRIAQLAQEAAAGNVALFRCAPRHLLALPLNGAARAGRQKSRQPTSTSPPPPRRRKQLYSSAARASKLKRQSTLWRQSRQPNEAKLRQPSFTESTTFASPPPARAGCPAPTGGLNFASRHASAARPAAAPTLLRRQRRNRISKMGSAEIGMIASRLAIIGQRRQRRRRRGTPTGRFRWISIARRCHLLRG